MRFLRAAVAAAVLASLVVLLSDSTAAAQNDAGDEEARVHFRLGQAYYDSGRFEEAAREFETAYATSRRPQLLYNVFVARRDAGHVEQATDALRRYLELVPDAPERDQLRARLRSLERMVQQRAAGGASGTTTASGETTSTETATETASSGEGAGVQTGGTGAAEATSTGDAAMASETTPTTGGGGGPGIAPWIVAGAGGALILTGAITGILALGAESDLEEMCPNGACTSPSFEDTRDSGQTLAVVTDVLLVTGVLAAGAGVAWALLAGGSEERPSEAPVASIACTTTACATNVRVSF